MCAFTKWIDMEISWWKLRSHRLKRGHIGVDERGVRAMIMESASLDWRNNPLESLNGLIVRSAHVDIVAK